MTFLRAKYNRGGNLGRQFVSHEQEGVRHVTGTYCWREEFDHSSSSDAPLTGVCFFRCAHFIYAFLWTEMSDAL